MKTRYFNITVILGILIGLVGPSCKDYLDVVPDNIPTVDHAFARRIEAERYLYGVYSYLPAHNQPFDNPAWFGGDEAWLVEPIISSVDPRMLKIAKGEQGTSSPIANYWASTQDNYPLNGGQPLFTGIRDANIFLENIHKAQDMEEWEREIWIAEVKVLKAYFHFWLLRMYGPIPIIDENIPMYVQDARMYREPVDTVAEYIAELLYEASESLPLNIENITDDLGRITRPVALALRAQVLTYAASPLFNGNTDYAGFTDDRGIHLFPQDYDAEKWKIAADALNEAIDVAHEAGHKLYDFTTSGITSDLNEKTIKAMQVRGAVTERWNDEVIWGDSRRLTGVGGRDVLSGLSIPAFFPGHAAGHQSIVHAPTLRMVEQFYTDNGVPIEEDKDWADVDLFGLKSGDEEHKYYIEQNFETINLHFNRSPRFYGSICFDGGLFYGLGRTDDTDMWTTKLKRTLYSSQPTRLPITGYLVKKVHHRLTSLTLNNHVVSWYFYQWPVIRLADLYLMYAEALNEYKGTPDAEVYEYIDLVRNRTGLNGVVESWANHSNDPEKPSTKEGMREIIHRERMNELAFEGIRFWDLRRWKLAEEYMNKPIRGLDMSKSDNEYYNETVLYTPVFEKKDYLWPISTNVLLKNSKLVQNPGW